MKKANRNNATEKTSTEYRKTKQAEQQHSKDDIGYQLFPDVPNKDTFDLPKFIHLNKQRNRENRRLPPLDTIGALI